MEGEEGETGVQRSHKMNQVSMRIGMLGQRQVTPRWENDPVGLHAGSRRESGQGRVQAPPPPRRKSGGGWRRAERVKNSRVAYVTTDAGA